MDLAGFIDTYRDAIAKRVAESYPPLYRSSEACARPRSGNGHTLPKLLRSPLGAQTKRCRSLLSICRQLIRLPIRVPLR